MLDNLSTNATVAKIHAVHGKMFTKENYHEMVNKRSMAELAEYLKRSSRFKDALHDVDPNTVHRGLLEEMLHKSNFNIYVKLCKFQGLDKTPFYNFLIQRIEIGQIISAVNRINTKVKSNSLADVPGYVQKQSSIDLMRLGVAENLNELKNSLKGTDYYKIIDKTPVDNKGRLNFTQCEYSLLTFYYKRLSEYVEKSFSSDDAEKLKEIIYSETDIININNAYRLRAFFGYSSEQIKELQLPFTKIGKRRMNSYIEKTNPEEMLEVLRSMSYGRFISGNPEYIEVEIQGVLFRYMNHVVARSTSAPVVMYAFMKLCGIEVNNIVHIIEGIRYDLDPAYIEKNLIVC